MIKMVYTVSQINKYIKELLDDDFVLSNIHIEAEISNFKAHSSGHLYFTIKDEASAMNAVMFRNSAQGLKFVPENGMKVSIYGYISLYEKTGQYQLYAEIMEPAGIGALYLAYEKLKERLNRAGLFDEKHKKPIPPYPKTIAILTSPTGAAVRDILKIAKRRNPFVKLVVVPTLVQGESAADDIVRAVRDTNRWGKADVIILGRGGGSIEDLWAFNEEKVARAVFESDIPVISAVGHETDFTITDFISDLRASTPSAAAELAVSDINSVNEKIGIINNNINLSIEKKLSEYGARLSKVCSSSAFKRFPQRLCENEIYVENLVKRLNFSVSYKTDKFKNRLFRANDKLQAVSPVNILKKGYSLVYSKEKVVNSVSQVDKGEGILIVLSDGSILADVTDKKRENMLEDKQN